VNHQILDQDLQPKEVVVYWVRLATRQGPVHRMLAVTQECVEQGVLAAGHPEWRPGKIVPAESSWRRQTVLVRESQQEGFVEMYSNLGMCPNEEQGANAMVHLDWYAVGDGQEPVGLSAGATYSDSGVLGLSDQCGVGGEGLNHMVDLSSWCG
jgi:hypothetical protein